MTNNTHEVYLFKKKFNNLIVTVFKWLLIIGLSYIIIYPIIKLAVPSFTYITEVDDPAVIWVPSRVTIKTFTVARILLRYGSTMLITVGYIILLVFIQTFIGSFVGYAFSRFDFPLRKFWLIMLVLTMIIPYYAIEMSTRYYYTNFSLFGLIPLFNGGKTINLLDKPYIYILLNILGQGLKGGFFIYIFIKFYSNIPEELEESALMDGAGFFRIYRQIILPNAKPAIITCIVLSFVWNYGDFQNSQLFNSNMQLLPFVLLRNVANITNISRTVALVYDIPRSSVTDMMIGAVQNAGILLFILPLIIFYFLVQR
ncbi:MAG TPA: carbohydrate ABC transporter permease, partial [Bacilli bacterium]|nr:carbohydrate ABC transporter permease [Bacilli bacterium]